MTIIRNNNTPKIDLIKARKHRKKLLAPICSHFGSFPESLPFCISDLQDGGESFLGAGAGYVKQILLARNPSLAPSSREWTTLDARLQI